MNEEIIKSIKASLYDRATSPLFGTFAVSWIIWNYRFIFVLFSPMSIIDKFSYIDETLYAASWTQWRYFLVYPLVTTALFIFVYPFPAQFVYEYWRKRQKELIEIRRKIEDETLLTVGESRKLRQRTIELEEEYGSKLYSSEENLNRCRKERDRAEEDTVRLRSELHNERQKRQSLVQTKILSEEELGGVLRNGHFRLFFDPEGSQESSKTITFLPNGEINEGKNQNESRWQISDGYLEILNKKGESHSRFAYFPESNIFLHTNDPNLSSKKGQYIIPV